jgi:hypothetical protein
MVSVLSIIPKVRGFNPVHGFLKKRKFRSTPSFGGEVKPEPPRRKILRHVKNHKYEQKDFARPNSSFPSPIPPTCYEATLLVGFPESSGGR